MSDPQRLRQIISNILWNAIKYTQKGYIYLHVQVDSLFKNNTASIDDKIWKCLQISVRDTGRGIELENIGKLFKLFGNIKSTRKAIQSGIGVGLAICQGLVQKFMGEITVDSRVDKGSKFTFKIMVQDITSEPSILSSQVSNMNAEIYP